MVSNLAKHTACHDLSIITFQFDILCSVCVLLSQQDEKEQLLQYRSTVAGLVGRAKSVVQLKPRNTENPVRTSLPVRAICDYRQIEVNPFGNMFLIVFSEYVFLC